MISEDSNFETAPNYEKNHTFVHVAVSLSGTTATIDDVNLTEHLTTLSKEFFKRKYVNVEDDNVTGLGASAESLLAIFTDLYHNHLVYFKLLTKLPLIVKVVKALISFIDRLRYQYLRYKWSKAIDHNLMQSINVTLRCYLNDKVTLNHSMKRKVALLEMNNLLPELIGILKQEVGRYPVNVFISSRIYSSPIRLSLTLFDIDDNIHKEIAYNLNKIGDKDGNVALVVNRKRYFSGVKVTVTKNVDIVP